MANVYFLGESKVVKDIQLASIEELKHNPNVLQLAITGEREVEGPQFPTGKGRAYDMILVVYEDSDEKLKKV